MNEEPEPNYFGRLLEVMSSAEIATYIHRLNLRGEVRVAEVLNDELLDRGARATMEDLRKKHHAK